MHRHLPTAWVLGVVLFLRPCLAAALPSVTLHAQATPQPVGQVQALANDAARPPGDRAAWQDTTLPDRWQRTRPDYAGTVWYRFAVILDAAPQAPIALVLPKLSMNADLWIDGMLTGRHGRMDPPLSRHWNRPLMFQPPLTAWRTGPNEVHIRVKARAGQDGGLGRLWIGPADSTAPLYERRRFRQSTLVLIANISVFALGLFFLFIWARKRQDVHYGYFAAGTLLWGLANTNMATAEPPLADAVWEWFAHMMLIWGLLLLGLFGLRFGGQRRVRLEWAVLVFALAGGAALALAPETWRDAVDLVLLVPVIALGCFGMVSVARAIRPRPLHDHVLFAVAAATTLGMGAHDWLLKAGHLPYEHAYALPFIAPVLLGAMAWLVAGEFARAQQDLAQLNRELGTRVEARERELRESYAQLGESERQRAVIAERARILRDMHDGVGTHLSAAIRQIETGSASSAEVAQSLRDSLDQLKLSVDAMNLPPGDVNALLAALRYRLQPRLRASGLELDWEVDELPLWPQGDGTAMRHLQYMLFELFSNALQHAGARSLTLSARADGAGIEIGLHDDGQGFGVPPEQALRSVRERAVLIDARLVVDTGPGGSRVGIRLPLGDAASSAGRGGSSTPSATRES